MGGGCGGCRAHSGWGAVIRVLRARGRLPPARHSAIDGDDRAPTEHRFVSK